MGSSGGIGAVRLRVRDLAAMQRFYERSLGLRAVHAAGDLVGLGADSSALVELVHAPDAPPRPPRTTGLFHLALLVPGRADLARAVRRIAGERWPLTGASDHLVSEAIYLRDPEGNGIEVYRDRPQDEWTYGPDGELEMATLPLDLEDVLSEAGVSPEGMAPGTRVGHVHLEVSDLDEAESFYAGTLGLDVTVRSYPGALFLSSGGYHHHVGLNTWRTADAPAPPEGAAGLEAFEVVSGDRPGGRRHEVTDPLGNRVLLRPSP